MTAKQLEYMYSNISNRMRSQGLAPEVLGLNPQNFAERYREDGVSQVKGTLLLEAIGKQEGIAVEDGEIDGRLEEIAKMANAPSTWSRNTTPAQEAREGLLAQIAEEKGGTVSWSTRRDHRSADAAARGPGKESS